MAKNDYSQDIKDLKNSLSYLAVSEDKLNSRILKILNKAYSLYEGYWPKFFPDDRIDPRIIDVYSFQKYIAGSGEIEKLIIKLNSLNEEEETKPEASIPPELESLVAEYEKNKALLESEEIKSNSQRSVAEQVKIAIAHSKIKQKALLNKQKRQARGEKFQDADKVLISLGSPKSDSKKTALAASYAAVREVALTHESFLKLSVEAQNRIIEEAVELNSICVTNIDVAIQSASLLINISDLSAEDQKNLSKISSNFVHSVYDAVNTQTTQAATLTAQIAENEIILLKYAEEVKQNIVVDLEIKLIQIKTLTETNQKLAQKIENLPKQLDVFVDNQAVAFQEFNKDSQTRLSKDPDTLDRIELANNVFISIHSNLENNGVQPRLFSSLDDAALLEAAIRHNMPGELNAHAGYQAEMSAALVTNSKTQDPDLSPQAILLYGKGLTPTLLAKARLYAKNNPESELGKLFKSNKDLFDAAGTQIRRIANSPLGKEITKVPVVLGKFANTPIGKNINKIITGWTKLTQPVTKFFSKISDKFPVVFGNIFRIVEDPIGAVRSWVGKKVGDYVVKKILSSTAGKAAIKAGTKIATELTKKGLGKALSKLAVSIGAKFGLAATGVGAIPAIIWLVGDIILSVIKGTVNVVQKVAVSVYGEKIKTRDVLIVPVVGAVSAVSKFFSGIGSATTTAASSAVGTLVLGVLVGFFFYVSSIVVAPLISTLVQLESIPKTRTSATGCANTEGIFISQRDPEWAGVFCKNCSPAGSCRIGSSGCSSASMTMILNGFGVTSNVTDVWHWQHSIGGYVYWDSNSPPRVYDGKIPYVSCGSDNFNSLKILSESGLSVTDIGSDLAEADSVLSNCGMILATGDMACGGGWCGHLLVIVAHEGNQITTMDPWMGENYIHTLDTSYKLFRMWAVVP